MTHSTRSAPLLWRILFCLWLAISAEAGRAHDVPGQLRMHALVDTQGDQLRVAVRVPLELLLNVDLPKHGNGYLDLTHVDSAFPRAIAATARGLVFLQEGEPLALVRGHARIALPSDSSFQSFDAAQAAIRGPALPASTDVFWNQGYFDALLEYRIDPQRGGLGVDFHVSPGLRDRLKLDLRLTNASGAVRAYEIPTASGAIELDPSWYRAAWTFVGSGFRHILSGWDHLVFLLCLVLPYRRLNWQLVGIVTSFTVAHSITLLAAANGLVPSGAWFPPLVETLIAASILYVAAENVLRRQPRGRWLLTAAFGLVHGFGFSFALAGELQFVGSHLLLSLLAFNVGIELGQLLVLLLVMPLLASARRLRPADDRLLVAIISAVVAHSAWHWMTERWQALWQSEWPTFDTTLLARLASAVLVIAAIVLLLKWRDHARAARRGLANDPSARA